MRLHLSSYARSGIDAACTCCPHTRHCWQGLLGVERPPHRGSDEWECILHWHDDELGALTHHKRAEFSVWRPVSHGAPARAQRAYSVGDVLVTGTERPRYSALMALKPPVHLDQRRPSYTLPVRYDLVWRALPAEGSPLAEGLAIWEPIPRDGYAALGCIVTRSLDVPRADACVCVAQVRACHADVACMAQRVHA